MSKPTLSQMVELVGGDTPVIGIKCGDKFKSVPCEGAVDEFGDVEVKGLDCLVCTVGSTRELAYNTTSTSWVIHI